MDAARTPASTLTDLVVTNEQTRALWRAGRASINAGLIVIACNDTPPEGFLENGASTFTIVARDGGGRTRRFEGVVFEAAKSSLPTKVVFR